MKENKQLKSFSEYILVTSLLSVLAFVQVQGQTQNVAPRLVVNIVVDQLRTDYMEAFAPLYGEKGFKRLMKEGRVYRNASCSFANADNASSVASLFTGTGPFENGIIGSQWLERNTLRPTGCVDDPAFLGLYSSEKTSPKNLTSSTLGDELKIATGGQALVYSISAYRDAAVMAAGHAGDGAFWFNAEIGKWSGSTFYGECPPWIATYNQLSSVDLRINDIEWKPSTPAVVTFNYFLNSGITKPFDYKFKGMNKFADFASSALINEEVTKVASSCLTNTAIGSDAVPDLLSVVYYAGNYRGKTTADGSVELKDTYVRLDKSIGDLMDEVTRKVGGQNVVFVLTSTGCNEEPAGDLKRFKVPTGTFYINRSASLLNFYLAALYGKGKYVDASYGNQIYLDHNFIEKKQLKLSEVLEQSQNFLVQCAGVKDVYTSLRLTLGSWTPNVERLRNAFNPKVSGDILVQILPGWNLVNENFQNTKVVRDSYIPFPLIFWGTHVKTATIDSPVTTDCVAPTLSQCLRIRAPNACEISPMSGVFK